MADNLHTGHRERIRSRFAAEGPVGFEDHELLEMYLFAAIPRRNTNDLAHALIQRFGSIQGVFAASCEDIQTVEDIGPATAKYLVNTGRLIELVNRQEEHAQDAYAQAKPEEYRLPADTVPLLRETVNTEKRPGLWLFCFDGLYRLCGRERLRRGFVRRELFMETMLLASHTAIEADAKYVLVLQVLPESAAEALPIEVIQLCGLLDRCFGAIGAPMLEYTAVINGTAVFLRGKTAAALDELSETGETNHV